jgi:hypothetical protein
VESTTVGVEDEEKNLSGWDCDLSFLSLRPMESYKKETDSWSTHPSLSISSSQSLSSESSDHGEHISIPFLLIFHISPFFFPTRRVLFSQKFILETISTAPT